MVAVIPFVRRRNDRLHRRIFNFTDARQLVTQDFGLGFEFLSLEFVDP